MLINLDENTESLTFYALIHNKKLYIKFLKNSSFKGVGVSNSANSDFNIEENDSKLINPNEAQSIYFINIMDIKERTIVVNEEIKILKMKVKVGTMIYDGSILLIYESINDQSSECKQKKLRSSKVGVVKKIMVGQGDVILAGSAVLELEKKCNHSTVIKDLCAECGADLQKENTKEGNIVSQASVSMVHMVPELKVNEELAQILGKADMDRLLSHKKLVLLVDLDQTLIHTTNDNIPNNIKDVYHFQLYGPRSPWYHTRLRPGTRKFLEGISEKYELHICTFGSRRYAHMIARFLDPDGKFFSCRILSRDECFDPNSKTANLKALFPCGENLVCIIDDREDVWDYASNLIHVKPYHFFQHTGDIHAPPNLTKCENDNSSNGFDFSQFTNGSQNENDASIEEKNEKYDGNTQENCSENNVIDDSDSLVEIKKNNEENNDVENNNAIDSADENKNTELIKNKFTEKKISETTSESLLIVEVEKNESANEKSKHSSDSKEETEIVSPKELCNELVIIEETDDYLLYLEEILKIIHSEFFKKYEENEKIPDLKQVIPETRAKVLEGVSLVFSGIVPNRMKLEDNQAFKIARSLGAKVTQNIELDTTHLVALRIGTAKVNAASKKKNLKLVTPEWLWTCAERWEKVDERLFQLKNAKFTAESRYPPAHCRSPEQTETSPFIYQSSTKCNSSEVSDFLRSMNPLMSLSSEDIETMEGEVEDIFKESDGEMDETFESIEEEEFDRNKITTEFSRKRKFYEDSSSSDEFEGKDENKIKTRKKIKRKSEDNDHENFLNDNIQHSSNDDDELDEDEKKKSDTDDESINAKFRRGEELPSDLDIEYNTEGTEEEQESDGEWNVMGAALEREFLEGE
ncbi:hypothetical protein PGB90_000557 [Kerria lacca]